MTQTHTSSTTTDKISNPADELLATLFIELFQTEESARTHARVEAERIPGTPPAKALLAVVEHAERHREELERLARDERLETTSIGARIGNALSVARDFVVDRTVSREKSYRGTLIGMHHGVDLVNLVRGTARAANRTAIVEFCDRWLAERPHLVEVAVAAVEWFAVNADKAKERALEPLS